MEHPAHRMAGMAADVAEELRGYLAPAVDLPWELTQDDHRDLLPRLCDAVARLAECIDSIAQATTDEDAKRQLTAGVRTILRGCAYVQAAVTVLPGEQHGPRSDAATRSPQLAATGFPQPMTGDLLQAASANPAPATTASARPASQAAPGIPAAAPGATEPGSGSRR